MTLSSTGYKRKEQPVRIMRGLWWQVDNNMEWHWFLSVGVFSTAFSWEFPCTSFVGNLPSKNGSRPLGGLINILLLCYKVHCMRRMTVPEQLILHCIKENGNNSHASEVARWLTYPVTLHRREPVGHIGPQAHLKWQTAWIQTEAVGYVMSISYFSLVSITSANEFHKLA